LYYEDYSNIKNAIAREKEIKGWNRSKKENLIRIENPDFVFLNKQLFDIWPPMDVPDGDSVHHRKDPSLRSG
jgi:putative endonuclease